MSQILNLPFSQGYVTTGDSAKNAYELAEGELVQMKGAFYRKNDAGQVYRTPGRTAFGTTSGTAVNGLAICQFDSGGTDKLLAAISTKIQAATPGTTGTFTDLITGLDASATRLTACHQDDRWYLGNGYDKNKCLKPDGTTRDMGMATPQVSLTASASSSAGAAASPTANSGTFTNPTLAYDGNDATYAGGTLAAAGTATHTWNTWGANATAGRSLVVKWSLSGLPVDSDVDRSGGIGTGGTTDAGYNITITLEKAEGAGAFAAFYTTTKSKATGTVNTSVAISDANDSNTVQFRATITYNSGTTSGTLRIYTVSIQYGSTTAAFDTTGTMYYTYTEYDSLDDNAGAPSEFTEVAAFTSKNLVTLTRAAAVNSSATHWRVYRSVPGAAKSIDSMGLVATVPIGQTTYADVFSTAATTQLTPLIPALTIGELSIPRDTQPPSFVSMASWKGSICGISRTNRRSWRYSEAGRPESFPEFYVVTSFPLDEHDGLVGQMAVGETMVLLCEGAVVAVDDLPRVVDGQFMGANARPLKGHPGCVGSDAFATFSVSGEPRGAWVSPFGVYVTNGQQCDCVSLDLAWENEVSVSHLGTAVLRWDAKNLILWFNFDSDGDGVNDREAPIHMAPIHQKANGQPKWGQPTPKATNCMASALISATSYRFSGHPSDGTVYVEESGYVDAATGSNVAMAVKTAKITNQKIDLAIIKASLIHSDFGLGETATLTATLYRDAASSSNSKSITTSVYGNRMTTVGVGRAGEAVDFLVEYSGTGLAGFSGIQAEVDADRRTGSAARWASASVTP